MPIIMKWENDEGFKKFYEVLKSADKKVKRAAARALNRTGDNTRTSLKKVLAKQTGLKQSVLLRALKAKKANQNNLNYEIYSKGGNISLKYFSPRERRAGVSAAPFSKRTIFNRSFMFGGRFPKRHGAVGHGHVFIRGAGSAGALTKVKSNVVIPAEMVQRQSLLAFQKSVHDVLPKRISHELSRIGL